jgi:hypothetical protein
LVAHSSAGDDAEGAPERSPPMIEIPTALAAFHDDFDEEAAAPPPPSMEVLPPQPLPAAAAAARPAPSPPGDPAAANAGPWGRIRLAAAGCTAAAPASQVIAAEPGPPALPGKAEAATAAFSAELAGLDAAPPVPRQLPPSPLAQRFLDDPLAALKAMSAEELVALFS